VKANQKEDDKFRAKRRQYKKNRLWKRLPEDLVNYHEPPTPTQPKIQAPPPPPMITLTQYHHISNGNNSTASNNSNTQQTQTAVANKLPIHLNATPFPHFTIPAGMASTKFPAGHDSTPSKSFPTEFSRSTKPTEQTNSVVKPLPATFHHDRIGTNQFQRTKKVSTSKPYQMRQ
jgi:hypothetical protein